MNSRPLRQRLLFYLLLALLCCIVPVVMTIIIISATADREIGMLIAVIPSVVAVHVIFSTLFLQTKRLIKLVVPVLTSFVAVVILKYILPLKIIHHLFDMYGFWDIVVTHLLLSVLIWEIAHRIIMRFLKTI